MKMRDFSVILFIAALIMCKGTLGVASHLSTIVVFDHTQCYIVGWLLNGLVLEALKGRSCSHLLKFILTLLCSVKNYKDYIHPAMLWTCPWAFLSVHPCMEAVAFYQSSWVLACNGHCEHTLQTTHTTIWYEVAKQTARQIENIPIRTLIFLYQALDNGSNYALWLAQL